MHNNWCTQLRYFLDSKLTCFSLLIIEIRTLPFTNQLRDLYGITTHILLTESIFSVLTHLLSHRVLEHGTLQLDLVVLHVDYDLGRVFLHVTPRQFDNNDTSLSRISYNVLFFQVNKVDDWRTYKKVGSTVLSFVQLICHIF